MKIRNTINYLLVLAFISTLFAGCAKDGATGPAGANGATGPTGPSGTYASGNLMGYVKTYDQYGSIIETNMAGISVSLTNGSTVTTTTDATGKYVFDSISTGYYSLNFSDASFGANQVSSFQFLGGATVWRPNTTITQIPNYSVSGLSFIDTVVNLTDSTIEINGSIGTSDANVRTAIVFVGSAVGTNSAPVNYQTYYTANIKAAQSTFKILIPLSDLYDIGYYPGQTIYFASYGISSPLTASAYEDFTTGRTVFTAISPNVFSSNHTIL